LETLGVRQRRILASLSAGQSISDLCIELRAPIPSVLRSLSELEQSGAITIENMKDGERFPDAPNRVDLLIDQSNLLRQQGQFDEAVSLLEVAVRMRPDADSVRQALREALEEQSRALYLALPPHRVPVVVATEDRVRRLRLRPEERFLLDRLSAHMDVGSLVMVSSMSERDTLKTLRKLLHSGIIELD
jgi:tetratricopeptide (TPR) repeat protein